MFITKYTVCNGDSQSFPITIKVDIRRSTNPDSKIKAHADVHLSLGPLGESSMFGFSVYEPEGKQPVVLPPAQKGSQRSFPHLNFRGAIKELINRAVLEEYSKLEVMTRQ